MSQKIEISSGNMLMDLRLVILRAIAEVWENDNSNNARERVDEIISKLETNDKPLQPDRKVNLRELLTHFSVSELSIYFACFFKYIEPFENFGIFFVPGTAVYNSYGDNEWSKPQHETMCLTLPSREDSWSEYEQTEKLMEYYQYFPTFFGSILKTNSGIKPVQPKDDNLAMDSMLSLEQGVDLSGNDYDLGVAEDSFLSFGAVINKIIAVAWSSKSFREEIDYDFRRKHTIFSNETDPNHNLEVIAFDQFYYEEILRILKEHFNFDFPWAFNLKFVFANTYSENEDYEDDSRNSSKASFWVKKIKNDEVKWEWRWNLPANEAQDKFKQLIRNTVSLEIPLSPTDPKTQTKPNVSLALAKYNAIGPAYPFTCS